MKRILLFSFALLLIAGMTACKDKKETKDIITKLPKKTQTNNEPRTMSTGDIPAKTINWAGGSYTIKITRISDKSLSLIEDASGNKYYDNKVRLLITRKDGSSFFDKEFTRDDFRRYTNSKITSKWGLTGFNFDTVDGSRLLFAIAIGSPDEMADNEFVPLTLAVDNQGRTSISTQSHDDSESEEDV